MRMLSANHPVLRHTLEKVREWNRLWVWTDVVVPMVVVRFALLLVGWLSQNILPNPHYPARETLARGYHLSKNRLLDVWARWDSGWYLGISQEGYPAGPIAAGEQSAFAFFPLYSTLVRLFTLLLPERLRTTERILIIGLLLSNIFLIGALILLHKLIANMWGRELARRTVLYTLLFPTGFFLSCFYTESTFLLLSVGAFYAASKNAWGRASLLGCLLSLTRPPGVLIGVPLLWMYLESIGWKLSKVRANVLWLAIVPAGLLAFLFYAYRMTGDFLAPVHAQKGWGKTFAAPWTTLVRPFGGEYYVTTLDQVLTVVFIALSVLALFKLSSAAYGIYALLLIVPALTSGTLVSASRYYVVVFPAFIMLGMLGKHPFLDDALKITLFGLQVWLMIGWSQSYWVV